MISTSLGRGARDRSPPLLRAVGWRAVAMTVPLVGVAVFFPDGVLSLFTGDARWASQADETLAAMALGMVAVVPAEIGLAAVFGTGDTDAGFVIEVLMSITLVACAAVAAVVVGLELPLVWLSLPLAAGLGLGLSLLWLRSGHWRRVVL